MTPGGCPATSGKTPEFKPDQMVGAARFAQNHPLRSLRPLREINPPPCGRDGVRPSPRCGISASTVAPLTLSSVFSNLLSVIRFLLLGFVSAPIMENRMAFFKPSAPPPKTSCKQPPVRPASALGRAVRPGDRSQLCTRLFHATRCKHTRRQVANSLRLFTT